jgi:hypothetical protein
VKNSNRDEQSAQTPSPDEPTLEPKEQWFIRQWQFDFVELLLIDLSNVTHKPTQAHLWINPE